MQENTRRTRSLASRLLSATAFVGVLAMLVPQLADASVSPKNGYYSQSIGKINASISTHNGVVEFAGANVVFKADGGGKCEVPIIVGLTSPNGTTSLLVVTDTKVSSKGRFKFSSTEDGITIALAGKFKNKNEASFRVTGTVDGCSAEANFKSAKFSKGG